MESAEDLDADDLNDLYKFYKDKFRQVTQEDLDSFQTTFRGSEEEKQDLLKYYQQFRGNMDQVRSAMLENQRSALRCCHVCGAERK